MRVEDPPVAKTSEDYVRLAVELASDEAALKTLKAKLRDSARNYLFDDLAIADEFAAFVVASVGAAKRGSKIPKDWQAGMSAIDG